MDAAEPDHTDDPPTPVLPAVLAGLAAELDALGSADPHTWADGDITEVLSGLMALTSRLDVITTAVAGVWDSRRLWASDGSRSARAHLARDTRTDPARCGRLLRRAAKAAALPRTHQAWQTGLIPTDRVDVITRAVVEHRVEHLDEGEPHLVWMARNLHHYPDFTAAVTKWCDSADDASPDGDPETRARRQRETRNIHLNPGLDGVKFLKGRLDAIDGEIIATELDRLTQQLFDADWAELRERLGDAATADLLPRTPTQRRADALRLMAERSAARPDGATPARPLITVLVDFPTLTGPVRELFNATVLTPGQIASLLTEADIERAVFAGPSRVIDLGPRTRLFTGATRRAIEIRDRHCTFPGCTIPAHLCQADHITEWAQGGTTTQDNGRLLCPAHNRQRPGRKSPPPWTGPDRRTTPDRRTHDRRAQPVPIATDDQPTDPPTDDQPDPDTPTSPPARTSPMTAAPATAAPAAAAPTTTAPATGDPAATDPAATAPVTANRFTANPAATKPVPDQQAGAAVDDEPRPGENSTNGPHATLEIARLDDLEDPDQVARLARALHRTAARRPSRGGPATRPRPQAGPRPTSRRCTDLWWCSQGICLRTTPGGSAQISAA